jgi:hypothetical protein
MNDKNYSFIKFNQHVKTFFIAKKCLNEKNYNTDSVLDLYRLRTSEIRHFLIKRIFPVSYYFQNVGRHFTRLLKKYLRSKRITGAAKKLETGTIRLAIDHKHILKIMRTVTQISSLPLQITQKVNMTV